ncbi:MAG TPA: NYN domain-containing protein [Planctomycetota bacterium]|nr:NYN domain-containing protein [Planctomycetota bacterium]
MIVIDGYNFLHALRGLEHRQPIRDLEAARVELHERLSRFQNITEEQVRVIYDARSGKHTPDQEQAHVQIVYAPPNISADDYIVRMVKVSKQPGRITVITSDRELGDKVKALQGRVMKCASFHRTMAEAVEKGANMPDDKTHEKPARPNPDEVDYWMNEFTKDMRKASDEEE